MITPAAESVYEREGEPTTGVNLVVLAMLMGLLGLTMAAAFLIPNGPLGMAVALGIAAAKAALVIAYFMHIRYEQRVTLVFAMAGFVWLGILVIITFLEIVTR